MNEEVKLGLQFLKKKFNLHNSSEALSAVKRTRLRTGEKVQSDPTAVIDNYLNRFQQILNRQNSLERARGINALKSVLHDEFVVKPDEIPESYWDNQMRIAVERGHGEDLEHVDWAEVKIQEIDAITAEQERSLDVWIDYLASSDATYPIWLKYFALRSIIGMGTYDKERRAFTKRSKGTTKPFPELNREALAYVLDAIHKKYTPTDVNKVSSHVLEKDEQFQKLLKDENFSKLYAWAIEKATPVSGDILEIIEGKWMTYPQGSDHMMLVNSLQGHGTGWCTAGESVAKEHLRGGDFHVYYSNDRSGQSTIPRIAIRMQGSQIAEVRGIDYEQNLDPYIGPVAEKKLAEIGEEGRAYEKKIHDMKLLTEISKKMREDVDLSKEELVFLYELNEPIEGFGYYDDPRIKELRNSRDSRNDFAIIYDFEPKNVAVNEEQLSDDTILFIGELDLRGFREMPRNLQIVRGTISFKDSEITSLGNLTSVIGDVNLNRSKINNFDKLETVTGSVFLSNVKSFVDDDEEIVGYSTTENSDLRREIQERGFKLSALAG